VESDASCWIIVLNAISCYAGMQAIFGDEEQSVCDVDSNVLHIPVDMARHTPAAEGDHDLCSVSTNL